MSDTLSIQLGGQRYPLLAAYGVQKSIEQQTDLTLQEAYELLLVQRLKIEEYVAIIWFSCNAAGAAFTSLDAVGDAVFAERVTSQSLNLSVATFLLEALYAPDEAKKKMSEEVLPALAMAETESD